MIGFRFGNSTSAREEEKSLFAMARRDVDCGGTDAVADTVKNILLHVPFAPELDLVAAARDIKTWSEISAIYAHIWRVWGAFKLISHDAFGHLGNGHLMSNTFGVTNCTHLRWRTRGGWISVPELCIVRHPG